MENLSFSVVGSMGGNPPGLGFWSLVAVGLLLGLRHATEADHVVAVSTIASESRNPLVAALIGGLWGVGHTVSIVAVGVFVLGLRVAVPEKAAGWLEFGIAGMIIALGVRAVRTGGSHHIHSPEEFPSRNPGWFTKFGFRPLLVGLAHGLAGSAALTLAVLSQIRDFGMGIFYLAAFGFGTVVGMMLASGCIGIPFALAGTKAPQTVGRIRVGAGLVGIVFGVWYGFTHLP